MESNSRDEFSIFRNIKTNKEDFFAIGRLIREDFLRGLDAIANSTGYKAIADFATNIKEVVTAFFSLTQEEKKAGKEISILGSIFKTVFTIITTSLQFTIDLWQVWWEVVKTIVTTVRDLIGAIVSLFTGDVSKMKEAGLKLKNTFLDGLSGIKEEATNIVTNLKKVLDKDKFIAKLDIVTKTSVVNTGGGDDDTTTKSAKDQAKQIEQGARQFVSTMAGNLRDIGGVTKSFSDQRLEELQAEHDIEMNKLGEKQSIELANLQTHEDNKMAILEGARDSRKELLSAEEEEMLEKEREKFELEKEGILEQSLSDEQRRLDDNILEQDWLNRKKSIIDGCLLYTSPSPRDS